MAIKKNTKRTLLVHALHSVRTESRNQRPVRLVCRHSAAGIWSHVAVVCSATLFALVCALALSRSLALTLFRALSLLFATVQSHVSRIGFRSCQTRSNRFSCIEAQVVGDRILSLSKTDIALVPNKLGLFRRHRFSSQCQTCRRARKRGNKTFSGQKLAIARGLLLSGLLLLFLFLSWRQPKNASLAKIGHVKNFSLAKLVLLSPTNQQKKHWAG